MAGISGCKEMDTDRIRGPWIPEEDGLLRQLVEKYGPRNWSLISKSIPGRSGKSCRLRWCNQLSPQVEHRPFTPEEDETIIRAHSKFGNKWATIARLLSGRTDNSIKNHWNSTLKRKCDEGKYTSEFDDQRPMKRSASSSSGSPSGSDVSDSSLRMIPFSLAAKPVSEETCLPLPSLAETTVSRDDPPTSLSLSLPGLESTNAIPEPAPLGSKLMAVMQEMIRAEVRNYMLGFRQEQHQLYQQKQNDQQSGLCSQQVNTNERHYECSRI